MKAKYSHKIIYGITIFVLPLAYAILYSESQSRIISSNIKNEIILCPFRFITGIPCPACGSTRATVMLMKGDFYLAFLANPISIPTNILFSFLFVVGVLDLMLNKNRLFCLLTKRWKKAPLIIFIIIVSINWGWVIFNNYNSC